MRTQASPDLCAESKWLIAFNFDSHTLHIQKDKEWVVQKQFVARVS
jgi:hypothetical protein